MVNEGRHQGGRAPYGYVVVDGGPHPNPRKAAEGYRLRILSIDESSAEVVRRIFAEYLDGRGDRAIANGLNQDGIPCPSARRPDQNRHRLADGWQGSTVRSILDNPRYTGYAFFGRWTKHETAALIDYPATVNLKEDAVLNPLNDWIGLLFAPENVDQTVAALAASQAGAGTTCDAREGIKARLTKAAVRLRRLQAAIETGVDPAAVVEGINQAQAERAGAKAELDNTPVPDVLSDAEIYAMIDSLGNVGAALTEAKPASLSRLYQQLRLQLRYNPQDQAVFVTAQPRVV